VIRDEAAPKGRYEGKGIDTPNNSRTFHIDQRLFEDVRATDPHTSHLAAKTTPRRLQDRERVMHALVKTGAEGLTDSELSERLPDMHSGSISKRRGDLAKAGFVGDSGRRRETPRGRKAIVWRALTPLDPGYLVGSARGSSPRFERRLEVRSAELRMLDRASGEIVTVQCDHSGGCCCDCGVTDCIHVSSSQRLIGAER